MNKVPIINNDVLKISHDTSKDWSHFKKFGSVRKRLFGSFYDPLPGLPKTLGRKPIQITEQNYSQFCTAHAIAGAIANQVGIPMSPEWQTAKIGQIAGEPILGGTDPKTALKSPIKFGALPQQFSPYKQVQNNIILNDGVTIVSNGEKVISDWNKYDISLDQKAEQFKSPGWYNVLFGNPDDWDTFDMIKIALWDSRDDVGVNEKGEKGFPCVIPMGYWFTSWNYVGTDGIIKPHKDGEDKTRHAFLFIDWTEINGIQYIVAQLSQGEDFGDKGLCYFTREEINRAWKDPKGNYIGMYIIRHKQIPLVNRITEIFAGLIHTFLGLRY